jgi:phosphate-selective porin OprO/OprP
MLTGEKNSFFGIKPERIFDPSAGTWGAFQVAARWSELTIDHSTFQNYTNGGGDFYLSSPTASVHGAQSWALGLNWFLNDNVKIMNNYEQPCFSGGTVNNADRPLERVFFSRVQLAF